jgi:5-aminolevulinate synthase
MGGYIAADRNIVDVVRMLRSRVHLTTSLSPVLVGRSAGEREASEASAAEREAQQANADRA